MKALIVVNREDDWPHAIPGAAVTTAKSYLTGPAANNEHYRQVVNLCRCARTDDAGFYVSLLAEARGQRPLPTAKALEDLHASPANAPAVREIEELAAQAAPTARKLELDVYFGADARGKHDALAGRLFSLAKAPLLRADFRRTREGWRLQKLRALSVSEIGSPDRPALIRAATRFINGHPDAPARRAGQPSLAILHNTDAPLPPSNRAALEGFLRAAKALGLRAEIIDRQAIERLGEFDALFLRDTTFLDHYTYRFAKRAADLGLVVIDDPDSIVQCNNKVFLNELLTRHHISMPRTVMVHRENIDTIVPTLGLPVVLKEPGGGFSTGVHKAHTPAELETLARRMLEKSELIIAQAYMPTEYDWRVTVLDRRVLFVCQYFMAPGHWQVHKYEHDAHSEGHTVALSIGEAPRLVVDTALRAANLIGEGLYGVDLKLIGERCYVIEINDNASIDAGNEDQILNDALYREVMGVFLRRIRERSGAVAAAAP
ncbi:MAG: RimK family protein [Betaproteobacteria bacterium]|nr:RimK family protein [Betaproteobacteria bacterium]